MKNDGVKRICSLCGEDQTPKNRGITQINDRRGQSLGLFGLCCSRAILQAVEESPNPYGNISREEVGKKVYTKAKLILKAKGL